MYCYDNMIQPIIPLLSIGLVIFSILYFHTIYLEKTYDLKKKSKK